jgi:hypothetical protein
MQGPVLSRVVLSWEAARACLSHALTTEHQEIMVAYSHHHHLIFHRVCCWDKSPGRRFL